MMIPQCIMRPSTVRAIDVKNINLQIKKHKNMFFTFIKNCKKHAKNIKLQYPFK